MLTMAWIFLIIIALPIYILLAIVLKLVWRDNK